MLDLKKLRKETEIVLQILSRQGFNYDLKKSPALQGFFFVENVQTLIEFVECKTSIFE